MLAYRCASGGNTLFNTIFLSGLEFAGSCERISNRWQSMKFSNSVDMWHAGQLSTLCSDTSLVNIGQVSAKFQPRPRFVVVVCSRGWSYGAIADFKCSYTSPVVVNCSFVSCTQPRVECGICWGKWNNTVTMESSVKVRTLRERGRAAAEKKKKKPARRNRVSWYCIYRHERTIVWRE